MFLGYVADNQKLYSHLQKCGYVLVFKPVIPDVAGHVKGNVDADLVLQVMLDYLLFNQALIITSDGDFHSLVKHLYDTRKLLYVMSPYIHTCSKLLRQSARERIVFMDNLKRKLEQRNEKAPPKDRT